MEDTVRTNRVAMMICCNVEEDVVVVGDVEGVVRFSSVVSVVLVVAVAFFDLEVGRVARLKGVGATFD